MLERGERPARVERVSAIGDDAKDEAAWAQDSAPGKQGFEGIVHVLDHVTGDEKIQLRVRQGIEQKRVADNIRSNDLIRRDVRVELTESFEVEFVDVHDVASCWHRGWAVERPDLGASSAQEADELRSEVLLGVRAGLGDDRRDGGLGRILRSSQRAANVNATCAPSCRVSGSPNFDGEKVG